jgi:hypothetical protein
VTSFGPPLVAAIAVVHLSSLPASTPWERAVPALLVLLGASVVGVVTLVVLLIHLLTSVELTRAERLRWGLALLLLGLVGNALYYVRRVHRAPSHAALSARG